MDCSFVDDCPRQASLNQSSYGVRVTNDTTGGSADDAYEQLGRFCPINMPANGSGYVDDFVPFSPTVQPIVEPYITPVSTTGGTAYWKYHFATRLFDYLTVQGGSDDYLPMADPNASDPNNSYSAKLFVCHSYTTTNHTAASCITCSNSCGLSRFRWRNESSTGEISLRKHASRHAKHCQHNAGSGSSHHGRHRY